MTQSLLDSPYVVKAGKILNTKEMTNLEKYFAIELPGQEDLAHDPGQFVMVSLPGVGEAPISVSSSPTKKGSFELVVRRAGSVTGAMHKLGAGDTVGIRGPFGRGFPTKMLEGFDLLFIGGGCGNIPLHSLITFVLDNRSRFGKINILLGCKTPETRLFVDELTQWEQRSDIFVDSTVDQAGPGWKGKVGLITSLIPGVKIDPKRTYAVIVGPPIMYKFVIQELLKREIPDSQIVVSLERHMKCGVGKCGHCQIAQYYCCQDGPVFTYNEIRNNYEAL
ncbi:MAG TPA: FAD/NAD(P)-binding protein [Candidatus Omnitrophota bacterium]|nr:FAD/NAD(P)-binding protein [Candidatus Omnitrophota bacterium]